MFRTTPQSELNVPPQFDEAGVSRWRLIESVGPGFFVAVMRFQNDDPATRRTVMLCWDSDLVHLVESPTIGARFFSLHHFSSTDDTGATPSIVREVREIWRGVDRDGQDYEVIVFKTSDGSEFCGSESISVPKSVQRLALIATVQLNDLQPTQ